MKNETFDPGDGRGPLQCFFHPHNCGLPAAKRRTERTVELPIADRWLASVDPANVVEIGAVTPYYWPSRIARVVDPVDARAAERASLFDVDLTGRDVLSISTIEHIGEGRYGIAENRTPLEALQKIAGEARSLLITFPCGMAYAGAAALEASCLATADRLWFDAMGISVRILARNSQERWAPAERSLPYGTRQKPWANAIIVLERSVPAPAARAE